MIHREIRLSLNIFNSHCHVNSVISSHLWCLGCCVSWYVRQMLATPGCWRQDQVSGSDVAKVLPRAISKTFISYRNKLSILLSSHCSVENKISCGILLSLEQCKLKILKHKMPLKKDVRQHCCMWRMQVPAGVCYVNNIPTDVRTPQITQGKQLYIHFSCQRCDGESINWLLSPFYEIANNCGFKWKIIDMFLLTEMLETTLEFSLNLTKKWWTDKQADKQIMPRPTFFPRLL